MPDDGVIEEDFPIVPSPFGDRYEVEKRIKGFSAIVLNAQGSAVGQRFSLMLPHQLYVHKIKALREAGYSYFSVAGINPEWVDLPKPVEDVQRQIREGERWRGPFDSKDALAKEATDA